MAYRTSKDIVRDPATVFEERNMVTIILYIRRNGPCRRTQLYEQTSRNPRMPDKIALLEEAGLIDAGKHLLTLTPAGEQVADLLIEISGIISGDRPPDAPGL